MGSETNAVGFGKSFSPEAIAIGFIQSVHAEITRDIPKDEFVCGPDCQRILAEVQQLADSRSLQGDKSDGRLYLHHMQPPRGFKKRESDRVLRELGLYGAKATADLEDYIEVSVRRAFEAITKAIQDTPGDLDPVVAGWILYILGTLLHTQQDQKHRQGNWTDPRGDGINSFDHFFWEFHQLVSDFMPSDKMKREATQSSVGFLRRFKKELIANLGNDRAQRVFVNLADFKMAPGTSAIDYRPQRAVMEYVFPIYKTVPGLDWWPW